MADSDSPTPRNDAKNDPLRLFLSESSIPQIPITDREPEPAHSVGDWFGSETPAPPNRRMLAAPSVIAMAAAAVLVVWLANLAVIRLVSRPVEEQAVQVQEAAVAALPASVPTAPVDEAPEPLMTPAPLIPEVERPRLETAISTPVQNTTPRAADRLVPTSSPTIREAPSTDALVAESDPFSGDSTPSLPGAPIADAIPRAEERPVAPPPPPIEYEAIAAAGLEVGAPVGTTAAPAPTAAPAVTAIESVLDGYVRAFNSLDVRAAKVVWPAVDERALGRAFGGLQQQEFELGTCHIDVRNALAVAACEGTARYVPKVGTRNVRAERRRWTFYLGHRGGNEWAIQTVDAR